jgi:hypothetical protein
VLPTIGKTFRPVWRKNAAAEEKNDFDTGIFLKMKLLFFDQVV